MGNTASTNFLVELIVIAAIGGMISAAIAYSKIPETGTLVAYFFLGALIPILGIIMACLLKAPVPPPLPPGWYDDPWSPGMVRYHDGQQWTYHSQPVS